MRREHDVQHGKNHIIAASLKRAFAQPVGQALPQEFLAMLAALDRSKQGAPPRS